MLEGFKKLFESKSFVGLIVSAVVLLAAKFGLDLDEATVWQLVALIGSWFGVQVAERLTGNSSSSSSDKE